MNHQKVIGLSFFSNQDFSAEGVVDGVCVWGQRPRPLLRLKSRGQKKNTILRSRFEHLNTIPGKFPQEPNIEGRFFCNTDPPSFRGREVIQVQLLRIFFLFYQNNLGGQFFPQLERALTALHCFCIVFPYGSCHMKQFLEVYKRTCKTQIGLLPPIIKLLYIISQFVLRLVNFFTVIQYKKIWV